MWKTKIARNQGLQSVVNLVVVVELFTKTEGGLPTKHGWCASDTSQRNRLRTPPSSTFVSSHPPTRYTSTIFSN